MCAEGEPSPTPPAGEILHEWRIWNISWSPSVVTYLTGLSYLPWVGMMHFDKVEKEEVKRSFVFAWPRCSQLTKQGELTTRYFYLPSCLSPIFTLAASSEVQDFAEHFVLAVVQPEFSHPKPCSSILKHYSIYSLWSFSLPPPCHF